MEILANNGHSMANEVGNAGLPDICQVEDGLFENGLLTTTHSAFGDDSMVDPSGVYLEDESTRKKGRVMKSLRICIFRPRSLL
jgi:hypothetical protein